MADEAKLCSPILSTGKALVVQRAVRHCHGAELGLSVNQCQLQALQFLVHLIDLLSILLRCSGFAGIQKAVVDQTGSRPPNSDQDPFVGASLALGDVSELLLSHTTELVIAGCIKSAFCCMSQSS